MFHNIYIFLYFGQKENIAIGFEWSNLFSLRFELGMSFELRNTPMERVTERYCQLYLTCRPLREPHVVRVRWRRRNIKGA